MKHLKFNNEDIMPAIGLGTWKAQKGEVYNTVKKAIDLGYRHFDCASAYGNEKEVGEALHNVISEGKVKREELWVTSKLWNNAHKKEHVLPALQQSLQDLRLDYLDLYLVHWPVAFVEGCDMAQRGDEFVSLEEIPLEETWHAMQTCLETGLIKHIGASNFSAKKLARLMEYSQAKPELNQIELHPYNAQNELVRFCQQKSIHVTAYAPLGSYERPKILKRANEVSLLKNETILAIAADLGYTPAQVVLSWQLQRDVCVIPKSTNPERLLQNLQADECPLTPQAIEKINALDSHTRFISGEAWVMQGSPYTLENIWDE